MKSNKHKKHFVSYEESSRIAREAGVKTFKDWMDFCSGRGRFVNNRKPNNVPSNPSVIYGPDGSNEWEDWATFLNTDNIANAKVSVMFISYEECRSVCHEMECRTQKEWDEFAKSPLRHRTVPAAPNIVYKGKGWTSWSDFLLPKFLPYDKAKKFIQTLPFTISTVKEWREYSASGERPMFIPGNPERVYLNKGWVNWPDFLGSERAPRGLGLKEAKRIVHKLHIRDKADYKDRWSKGLLRPSLPKNPEVYYQGQGWKSWDDFLGPLRDKPVAKYEQAKNLIQATGIKQAKDFHELKRVVANFDNRHGTDYLLRLFPMEVPDNPREYYSSTGDWVTWQDFLLNKEEKSDYEFFRKRSAKKNQGIPEEVIEEARNRYLDVVENLSEYRKVKDILPNSIAKPTTGMTAKEFKETVGDTIGVKDERTWKALVVLVYRAYQDSANKELFDIFSNCPLFPEDVFKNWSW